MRFTRVARALGLTVPLRSPHAERRRKSTARATRTTDELPYTPNFPDHLPERPAGSFPRSGSAGEYDAQRAGDDAGGLVGHDYAGLAGHDATSARV